MKLMNLNFVKNLFNKNFNFYQTTWQLQQKQLLQPCLQQIFNNEQHKQSYHHLQQQIQQQKQLQREQQYKQQKQQQYIQNHRQWHALVNKLETTAKVTKAAATTTTTTLTTTTNNNSKNVRAVCSDKTINTIRRSPTVTPNLKIDCEKSASDFVLNLTDQERECIENAIERFKASQVKDSLEVKLAATQWRTRFGRPSKLPALKTVDPTGTFCAFPEDWLKKKLAAGVKDPEPKDLLKIFFVNAVPFVAFGFLDNFTMIIAGDYIEILFGRQFAISTMAAAGLGNTISDMLGIGSAYYVERGCAVMGLNSPVLTPAQMELKSVRRAANWGRLIGITLGCLLGMCPLLWLETGPSASAIK